MDASILWSPVDGYQDNSDDEDDPDQKVRGGARRLVVQVRRVQLACHSLS